MKRSLLSVLAVVATAATALLLPVPLGAAKEPRVVENARVLRVVDQDKRVVPGVTVKKVGEDKWHDQRTDAKGEARFDAGRATSVDVTFFDGRDERTVALKDALTEVVAAHYPEAEIVVVDGTSGRPIDGVPVRVVSSGGDLDGAPRRSRVATDAIGWCAFDFAVAPPAGFVSTGWNEWSGQVAVRATRVRLTVPVYPEVRRRFRVVDAAGRPVAGAHLARLMNGRTAAGPGTAAWRKFGDGPAADADGFVDVAGLPLIPLGRASLTFEAAASRSRTTELEGRVEIALDAPAPAETITVQMGKPEGPWFPPGMPQMLPKAPPRGPIFVVRVLLRDGSPAPRVTVVIGDSFAATDADGRARFVGLASGPAVAKVYGRGILPTVAGVKVGGAEETTIHEGPSRRIHVEVVDGDGHPLACAGVSAGSRTVRDADGTEVVNEGGATQFDGEVEIIDSLTDATGRVDLDVAVGRHRVCAWIGDEFAFVDTTDESVKIVLQHKK